MTSPRDVSDGDRPSLFERPVTRAALLRGAAGALGLLAGGGGAMAIVSPVGPPWEWPPVLALRYISTMKRQNMAVIMMTPGMAG